MKHYCSMKPSPQIAYELPIRKRKSQVEESDKAMINNDNKAKQQKRRTQWYGN